MMSEPLAMVRPDPTEMTDAELAELGITRIVTEQFEVGAYRYSKLSEALMQAQRKIRLASTK